MANFTDFTWLRHEDFSTKTTTNEKITCQFEMGRFKKPFCWRSWRSNLSK